MKLRRRRRPLRSARAAAERASQSRAEFIANVSHELRTPLNAIVGYSELLLETAEERRDQAGAADTRHILSAASKLRSMVNDILKLSAIDAGRVSVEAEEIDLEDLVASAIEAQSSGARAKGNLVAFERGASPQLVTDGAKLDFCLRALLSHSIAFTRDGVIAVRLSERHEGGRRFCCVEVEDNGLAIDPQTASDLFEPFAYSDDAGFARFEGPDLSLALARRLARLLEGDITATAREQGGLAFTLTTPLSLSPQAAVAKT